MSEKRQKKANTADFCNEMEYGAGMKQGVEEVHKVFEEQASMELTDDDPNADEILDAYFSDRLLSLAKKANLNSPYELGLYRGITYALVNLAVSGFNANLPPTD